MKLLKYILRHRFFFRILILLSSLVSTIFGLFSPYFQKSFIDQFTTSNFANLSIGQSLGPLFLAFACMLSFQIFSQLTNWLGMRESVLLQRLLADMIYRKTLSLKVDTPDKRTVGETVSLYTTDVSGAAFLLEQTLPIGFATTFPLLLAPYAISELFRIPLWPTFLSIFVITTINTLMAFRQSQFFFLFKFLAAERIAIVNEWIQNIRVIRILGWTEEIEKRILVKRIVETKNRVRMVTNGQFMNALATTITFVLNIVAIVSLLKLRAEPPTPGELLALLWILGVFLIRPFRQMPWFFTFAFDAWTSIKRLEDYLKIENPSCSFDAVKRLANTKGAGASNSRNALESENKQQELKRKDEPKSSSPYAMQIENLNLKIQNRPILKNISFSLKRGEFVGIVGEVGSGKTLFLLSLLGETAGNFDSYRLEGQSIFDLSWDQFRSNFSYVPQEGFIMSSSLRDNVFFEYRSSIEFDESVQSSLMNADFDVTNERSSQGLNTLIGERGVNLSGGQKQRVSIARANFKNSNVILLDDTFSAVDVGTEQRIIRKMIRSEWREKSIVLTTHRMSVLEDCDRILFMKDGLFVDEGNLSELLSKNAEFAKFVLEKDKHEDT